MPNSPLLPSGCIRSPWVGCTYSPTTYTRRILWGCIIHSNIYQLTQRQMNWCIHHYWGREELREELGEGGERWKQSENEKLRSKTKQKKKDMNKGGCSENWWNGDCLFLANGWPAGMSEDDVQLSSSSERVPPRPVTSHLKTVADVPLSEQWENR